MRVEKFAVRVGGAAGGAIVLGHRVKRVDVIARQRVALRPVRPSAEAAEDRLGARGAQLVTVGPSELPPRSPAILARIARTSLARLVLAIWLKPLQASTNVIAALPATSWTTWSRLRTWYIARSNR